MKRILTTIQKRVNKILLLAVLAGAMASCDSVLDYNEGDCSIKYLVKFKYDYNMEKVDAFAQEVRTVTLYAFDDNGNMVYYKTDQGEMLADGNYSMSLDFDPGEYHLIAWAGLDDQSFAVPVLYPQTSQITELKVKTLREEAVPTRSEDEKDKYIVEKEREQHVIAEYTTNDRRKVLIKQSMHYESASQINRIKWQYFIDDKFHSVQNMDMRLFFPQELNSYLRQIGFNIIHKFGDFTERKFDDNSEKQIYILELKK